MPTFGSNHRSIISPPRSNALAALIASGIDLGQCGHIFVPGRVELLGKHTDYAGGRSLLCAVERGIDFVYVPREDQAIRVFHPASGEVVEFALDGKLIGSPGHWSNYLMTVALRVARNFPGAWRGVDLAFDSSLPAAAGLSSSSALVVGMFLTLSQANFLEQHAEYRAAISSKEELAGYLGCVENGQSFENSGAVLAGDCGVGTMGGSQDHTAILCCASGEIRQFGFHPVRLEDRVAFPAGYQLVVACSGVEAAKTGAAQVLYNRNPLIVRRLLEIWNGGTGRRDACLAAAVRSDGSAVERLRRMIRDTKGGGFSCETLVGRLEQFVEESEGIIPSAMAAIRAGELLEFGRLVDLSQEWAQRGLGNQVPQTIFLAKAAREAGAIAASAFGAGFGGSVWALVKDADAEAFQNQWMGRYRRAFPVEAERASMFVTGAGVGATTV